MEYIFSKVIKRLKSNIKNNILIAVQIMFGVILFALFLNVSIRINKEYRNYTDNNENYRFSIVNDISKKENTLLLSEDQYNFLSEIPDIKIDCEINTNIITFAGSSHIEDGEEILDKYIVKYSSNISEIYAEPDFISMAQNAGSENTLNFDDLNFSFSENSIFFSESISKDINLFDDDERYVHTLVIPLKYYFSYGSRSANNELKIDVEVLKKDHQFCNEILYKIENGLKELNNECDYIVESRFFNFLRKAASDKEQALFYLIISICLIIVVYIGILSLFMMLIEKRTFELSICLAVGAKTKQLFIETALELFSVSFIPTALALFSFHLLTKNGFTFINIFVPRSSIFISLTILLGIFITNMLCLILLTGRICKLKPREILKEY